MLGLSKSHVRNVLNAAEKLGTLSHGERRRRIRLSAVFLAETRSHLLNLAQLVARTHGNMSLGAFSGYQRSAYAANFSFSTQASYC
jgi:hypothetical protein